MTYISSQPRLTDSWDDICYPIRPVWLAELLPDYEIVATDRQQLIVGEAVGGRSTIFGIQSADYTIIPNAVIREVIDGLISTYQLLIKYTPTGEFSINIILPDGVQLGKESLQRSLIITNSYNGKTPFSIQGQTLMTLLDPDSALRSSMFRQVCQNGLMGWADQFADIPAYQTWLHQWSAGTEKAEASKSRPSKVQVARSSGQAIRKIHHRQLTQDMVRLKLHDLLADHLHPEPSLTEAVYSHLQETQVKGRDEDLLRELPVPAQLTKQARERLRTEEHLLKTGPTFWLLYNAVNYALFTSRSSLTLNDRYRLDERVFHQLAARAYA